MWRQRVTSSLPETCKSPGFLTLFTAVVVRVRPPGKPGHGSGKPWIQLPEPADAGTYQTLRGAGQHSLQRWPFSDRVIGSSIVHVVQAGQSMHGTPAESQ